MRYVARTQRETYSGRGENQDADLAGGRGRASDESLDRRDEEGDGLSGSSLGLREAAVELRKKSNKRTQSQRCFSVAEKGRTYTSAPVRMIGRVLACTSVQNSCLIPSAVF